MQCNAMLSYQNSRCNQLKTWQNAVSRSLGWIGSTFTRHGPSSGDMVASATISTPSAMSQALDSKTNYLYSAAGVAGMSAVFAVGMSLGALVMSRFYRGK
jgi:hypothetical protein